MQVRTGLLAAAALVLGACATAGGTDGEPASWRKITQIAQRTSAYVSQPTARAGDQVTFGLAFVYAPNEIMWENKPVAWQLYQAVTIDCAKNEVRLGKRSRYDESRAVMMSDDAPDFAPVSPGTVADDAAMAVCKDKVWVDATRIPNGKTWVDQARANLAATAPIQRPPGWSG